MARKTQKLRPVMVRLPESLRRQLGRLAAENGRSMNTEIIHRLKQAVTFVGPSGEIPGQNAGELRNRKGGGAEMVMNLEGKLYRFVTEDTVEVLKEDSES
jgi:hypothetical protein